MTCHKVTTDAQCIGRYLYSGKRFNNPDEVLLQQVVVQLGQVSVDNWVISQFSFVLC